MKRLVPIVLLLAACGDCGDAATPADAGDNARFERDMGGPNNDPNDTTDDMGGGGSDDGTPPTDMTSSCGLELRHSPITSLQIGNPLDITAQIEPAPDSATLHYKRGHETQFNMFPITEQGGSWLASLPAAAVSFSGIDYWIEATLGDCTVTSPAENPDDNPHHIDVFGEYRVTQAGGQYEYTPDVWGRQVVYAMEEAAGNSDDIVLFDLDTLQALKVTDDARAQGNPRIFGKNVAFVDNYASNPEIAVHDLETGMTHRVTNQPAGQYGLEIDGHIIVWRDDRNMGNAIDGDIYGYDLGPDATFGTADDRGELELVRQSRDQTAPKVHVDADGRVRIVYASMVDDVDGVCDANCDWNVYLLDFGPDGIFGTGDDIGPTRLTTEPNEQRSPVIWGTRIAWLDARGGNWLDPDIWFMDLGPDGMPGTADDVAEQELATPVNDPDDLAIWETTLVWEDYRTMGFELYAWDFASNSEAQLTDIMGGQFYPEIWDNVIVWQDARNNAPAEFDDDIYVLVR